MLTAQHAREALSYDPDTGVFRWASKVGRKVIVGAVAGSIDQQGYVVIGLRGKTYRGQRIAVLIMTGEWPTGVVDHRDRNKANNSWINLRPASRVINGHNAGVIRRNTSGIAGVSYHAATGKWRAQISINRKHKSLGLHASKEAAGAAYAAAKSEILGECA